MTEKKKADALLLNILPKIVAEELKDSGKATTRRYNNVTILFTDFEEFTKLASTVSPVKLVGELNDIFSYFDGILETLKTEKIKTIGDGYFAVCGLPESSKDHAHRCIEAAKQMLQFLTNRNKNNRIKWKMRVGIHSGPVVAGVVGKNKYAYDLFGDTVNTASRLKTNGEIGKINISETTYQLVKDQYNCVNRGQIQVKGKGAVNMYFVE